MRYILRHIIQNFDWSFIDYMNLHRNKCPNDEKGSRFKSDDIKLGHPDPSGGSNFLPITRLRWIKEATGGDLVLSSSCL